MTNSFSHLIFWDHPLTTLSYFAFAMSFLSLWIRKTPWLWGSFAFIAVALALNTGTLSWVGLIPLILLGICHSALKHSPSKKKFFFLFCTATAISCALIFHLLPGFHNWQILSKVQISPDGLPYSLWLNFDRPWVGLFPLALTIPLISSKAAFLKMLKIGLPLSILGILIMIGISVGSGQIRWDLKIPLFFFIWVIDNLIFVCIPEEAFFRGFIQKGIYDWFEERKWAGLMSIFLTSLLFTLAHIHWIKDPFFLAFVCLASIIYGTIYQITRSIEASILCHFGLNLAHVLLFTYPALNQSA